MDDRLGTLGRLIEILDREDLRVDDGVATPEGHPVGRLRVDSRDVEPGDLFCAVRGVDADGHDFLTDAIERGAGALVVERVVGRVPVPAVRVRDGRAALAALAAELYAYPWREVRTVGVTGTNGKTTTVFLLRALLQADGGAGSIGTLGAYGAGGELIPGTRGLTTPGTVEAARWLRDFADEGLAWCTMEVSSHALDQRRLGRLELAGAALTSLSRDHLDYHGTFEAYRAAKLRIVDMVRPDGFVVVNADDPGWEGIEVGPRRLIRVGLENGHEVSARDIRLGRHSTSFRMTVGSEERGVRLPLIGTHNVTNALICAGALRALGWEAGRIASALDAVPQVPGRMQRVAGGEGMPTVLIDYCHTPDALERALRALRPLTSGRVIAVFGASGNRDRGKRPDMGAAAARNADLSFLTSDNPRDEKPEEILDDVERGMKGGEYVRMIDREEAIRAALRRAEPGDIVLLAGKGHEWYMEIRGVKHPFVEADIVRSALRRAP